MESRRMLSDLPDDVIHRIISLYALRDPTVANKNAVRLSLLSKDISKEISNALQSCPTLCFQWTDDSRCLQELKYLTLALKHNTRLQTLTIGSASYPHTCSYPAFDHSGFDRCLELAATNSPCLRKLDIMMWPSYLLPQAILRVESLVWIYLRTCALGSAISWPCLKRLHLVIVEFRDEVFDSMIRGCPFIETLEIAECRFTDVNFHIKVSNLSYLKYLNIWLVNSQTLEVDAAPSLVYLAVTGVSHSGNRLIDMGDKVYHKLKYLRLELVVSGSQALSGDFFTNMEHQYPRLQELFIQRCNNIKRINISSSSLEKIDLIFNPWLEEATFDVPNIQRLRFQSRHLPKLSVAGNSNGWISIITFVVKNANIDSSSWLMELKKHIPASNMADIEVIVYFEKGFTEFHICAEYMNSPYSDGLPGTFIQKLIITRRKYEAEAHLAMKILEGMLSICRPQRIHVMKWQESQLPKLLYGRLMMGYLAGINDLNSEQGVSKIGFWIEIDEEAHKYQNVDKGKFLKQFEVDDDVKAEFTFFFKLEYYWRPQHIAS